MNSNTLINILTSKYKLSISNNINNFECIRLQIILNNLVNLNSNLVYLSTPSMNYPNEFKDDCLYILYTNNLNDIPTTPNTLYYQDPGLFSKLCDEIHIQLINVEDFKYKENAIYKIFQNNNGLSSILEKCFDLFKNPLLINDAAFKCLGTWPNTPIGIRKFDQMLEHGYALKDYLTSAEEIINVTAKFNLTGTYSVHFKYYDNYMTIAVTPILYHNNVIGGIEIIEHENQISETDIQLLNLVSMLLPLEILHHLHQEIDYGNNFNQLFYDLVSLKPCDYDKMTNRLNELSLFNNSFLMMYVEIPYDNIRMPHLFINELKDILEDCHIVLQEHSTLLFINSNVLTEDIYNQLLSFSLEHNAIICVSEPYDNLIYTHYIAEQLKAMALLLIQNNITNGIHNFKEYHFSTLFHMISNKELLNHFIHPGIIKLAEYDNKHNSSFLYTLKCYLLYQCNAAECSKHMNLHRNSLIYRIEKISSIIGISLDNPYDCFNLQTSIILYETLN